MRTNRLGRTDLAVSELIFGGGFVGGVMVLKDEATRRSVLTRALDAGINWIDTAPRYGDGKSERHLGELLTELDSRPFLSTKVRLDPTRLDDIAGQVERSITQSLERLQLPHVDLVQLHNQIFVDAGEARGDGIPLASVLDDGGVADALDRLRDQGLTRFVGLTALGHASALVRAIDSGRFDTAQVYYNLLNPSAGRTMPDAWQGHDFNGVLAACERHDVGVMGIRIFAAGVLASDQRSGREVVITEHSELTLESARAQAVFEALGTVDAARAQTALRFGLANPQLHGIVIGMAEPAHLEAALEASRAGPLSARELEALEPLYTSNFARAR